MDTKTPFDALPPSDPFKAAQAATGRGPGVDSNTSLPHLEPITTPVRKPDSELRQAFLDHARAIAGWPMSVRPEPDPVLLTWAEAESAAYRGIALSDLAFVGSDVPFGERLYAAMQIENGIVDDLNKQARMQRLTEDERAWLDAYVC